MKRSLLFLLPLVLLLGCIAQPQESPGEKDGGIDIGIIPGGGEPPREECTPDYSFSDVENAVLSDSVKLIATVSCAGGKTIEVKVDGITAASKTVETNATTPLEFNIVAAKDGTSQLTVESDGEVVHSRTWEIAALGNDNSKGMDFDAFSFKKYLAYGFEAQNPVRVGRIRAFMKRLEDKTQSGTQLLIEIRKDENGEPEGALVSSVRKPITDTTLSDNWIRFDFGDAPLLQAGRYWVVFKIDQTENIKLESDNVMLHYTIVGRQEPGNDYTRIMVLDVDEKTGSASETEWEPLPYDKSYSVTIHAAQ